MQAALFAERAGRGRESTTSCLAMKQTIRVAYWPEFSTNPYLSLLYQGAVSHAVEARPVGRKLTALVRFALLGRRPHVLHLHWLHPAFKGERSAGRAGKLRAFLWALDRLAAANIKLVWTVHNLENHDAHDPALDRRCREAVIARADAVVVHSGAAREAVIQRFPRCAGKPIYVVPHGNYLGVYPERAGREAARRAMGIAADETVVLFFGMLRAYKGVAQLLDSFERLPGDGFRLVIAGVCRDEALRHRLETTAARTDRVHAVPRKIPAEEVHDYFAAADVVALPFQRSLTSGSLMLAMSMGKPVVAPGIATVTEMLGGKGGELLYDPDAADGLSTAIRCAARLGSARLARLGNENLATASHYDWPTVAGELRQVYERVMSYSDSAGEKRRGDCVESHQ